MFFDYSIIIIFFGIIFYIYFTFDNNNLLYYQFSILSTLLLGIFVNLNTNLETFSIKSKKTNPRVSFFLKYRSYFKVKFSTPKIFLLYIRQVSWLSFILLIHLPMNNHSGFLNNSPHHSNGGCRGISPLSLLI